MIITSMDQGVVDTSFRDRVLYIVSLVPKGSVATYGFVALLAGAPRAARAVGDILHYSSYSVRLPYQRIINKNGGLAKGYTPGGTQTHKQDLEADGVVVNDDFTVDMKKYFWRIDNEVLHALKLPIDLQIELAEKYPLSKLHA